jgi:hypothetical protein
MVNEAGVVDPESAPVHSTNCQPLEAVAVNCTTEPSRYDVASGLRVIVPCPVAADVRRRRNLKFAVTVLFASIVTVIGLELPEASPLQWLNPEPDDGVAVN